MSASRAMKRSEPGLPVLRIIAEPASPVARQTVSGLVWSDANRNGVKDAGEAGLEGATVTLTQTSLAASVDAAGRRIFTDKDGGYRYDYVATGGHVVSVAKPGYFPSTDTTVPVDVPKGGLTVPPVGVAWAPAHVWLPVIRR